jgi:hypothetical protein
MNEATKATKFTLSKLDAHLKGKVHSRREQLRRAFKLERGTKYSGKVACPVCPGMTFEKDGKFLNHVLEHHPLEMWEVEDEDEDEDKDEDEDEDENEDEDG